MMISDDIPNSKIEQAIDEYIRNEKYRVILKKRLIDGKTYERIAEETDMSPRQIKTIIYKTQEKVLLRL